MTGPTGLRVVVAASRQFLKKGARLTAQVMAACGHACGMRVQRVLRVLRFDSPSG